MHGSPEDVVWNRACSQDTESLVRAGDRSLADMILLHSLVMNGGVHHALEVLSHDKFASGISAFHLFGLSVAADVLSNIRDDPELSKWTELTEAHANRMYTDQVSDDEVLVTAFNGYYWGNQNDFDPVSDS